MGTVRLLDLLVKPLRHVFPAGRLNSTKPAGLWLAVLLVAACSHPPQVDGPVTETIGTNGGSLTDGKGQKLVIPSGTFNSATAVTLKSESLADITSEIAGDPTRDGLTFLSAVGISTGGATFNRAASLSFPGQPGKTSSSTQPLLMKVLPSLNGLPTLVLVDAGTQQGGSVVTGAAGFPGIQGDGEYVLVMPQQPVQFVSGTVEDGDGNPVDNAVVYAEECPQLAALTDPGNFVIGLFNPQGVSQMPVSLVTLGPPAHPGQFGFMTGTINTPGPPIGIGRVPIGNSTLTQLASEELRHSCDQGPDAFLADKLKDLVKDVAEKLASLDDAKEVEVTPASVNLTPSNPSATLTIDYGAYYNKLLAQAFPGSADQIKILERVRQLALHEHITNKVLALGVGTPVFPRSNDTSLVTVDTPVLNGLTATQTIHLAASAKDGTTTIGGPLGCLRTLTFQVEDNYSLAADETSDTFTDCPSPEEALDINPADGTTVCPTDVVVTVSDTGALTVTLSADSSLVQVGETVRLHWDASALDATCSSNWTNESLPSHGDADVVVANEGSNTYSIQCSAAGAQSNTATTVVQGTGTATISLALQTSGPGSISTSPQGTSCGVGCQAYAPGTVVAVSAFPATSPSHAIFLRWSGDCSGTGTCNVTMNSSRSVSAAFGYPLIIDVTGSGSVAFPPGGVACGSDCMGYAPSSSFELAAVPDSGATFQGWGGACSGIGSCAVTMNSSQTVSAAFDETPPPAPSVSIDANPKTVTVGGSTTVTWSSSNASTCTASGAWSGSRSVSGQESDPVSNEGANNFQLQCTGSGGSKAASVTVTGTAPPSDSVHLSPGTADLGDVGGCAGGSVSQTYTVTVSPPGTTWSVDTSQATPPDGVTVTANPTSGTGSGSFVVTVAAAPQSPTPGFSCSDTYTLDFDTPIPVPVMYPDGTGGGNSGVYAEYHYVGVN